MTLQDPSEIPGLRISDADRDRAASLVSEAFAQGRLSAEEHSERLDAIYAARTRADIVPLVRDIPGAVAALDGPAGLAGRPPGSLDAADGAAGRPTRMVALFSGIRRKGTWRMPATIDSASVFGDTDLDLRDAVLAAREVRIRSVCVFGETRITVPPEMHVADSGFAVFGGRQIPPDTEESASPDAPVLRVSGISLFGLLTVRRERRPANPEDQGAERGLPG